MRPDYIIPIFRFENQHVLAHILVEMQLSVFSYSNSTHITMTSPPFGRNGSLTEDFPQALVLTVAGEIVADVEFVYMPNPIITDVFPLKSIEA